jgi:hypothetical protein
VRTSLRREDLLTILRLMRSPICQYSSIKAVFTA